MSTSRTTILCLLLTVFCVTLQAQEKRPLTHDDYDGWKSARSRVLSHDGQWVAFVVSPQVGDGELVVRETKGEKVYRHPRGSSPKFAPGGGYVVFSISPSRKEKRDYDRARVLEKKAEKPRAMLGILDLKTGGLEQVKNLKDFKVPAEGPPVVVYRLEGKKEKDDEAGKDDSKAPATERRAGRNRRPGGRRPSGNRPSGRPSPEGKKEGYLVAGSRMIVRNLAGDGSVEVPGVVGFGLTRKRGFLWFSCSSKKDKKDEKDKKDKKDEKAVERGLFAMDLGTRKRWALVKGGALFSHVVTDHEVTRLAFLSNRRDRDSENPTWDLYAWDFNSAEAKMIVSHTRNAPLPPGKCISSHRSPEFSRDGSVLLFGASDMPKKKLPKILKEDQVVLDLWHWKDPILQPMQAKRAGQLRNRSLACTWSFNGSRVSVVGREGERVGFMGPKGSRVLAQDGDPYAQLVSWDGRYSDVYVIDVANGRRRAIRKMLRGRAQSSPDGRYVLWFEAGHWIAADAATGEARNLTKEVGVAFWREQDDTPQPAGSYGVAGWTRGDREVLLYDRYDVWRIVASTGKARCLTDGHGRSQETRFRYIRLDTEERFIPDRGDIMLSTFHTETMASGYSLENLADDRRPRPLVHMEKRIEGLVKAKEANQVVFSVTTFEECGDVWTSDLKFLEMRRLSDINPQQSGIRWGKAELVRWHSSDGVPLKGILVKPEGFDPRRRYPMMVYFYERRSENLHRYVSPSPGTSPNAAYYVSNGYLWFIPDIVYREGYPGESCVKCVVSGVQNLIDRGFVDATAIGAAGHSWGGYQTAYLVTRTNIFKAVESGAPVSNMTSAYGGIRWGTGMSRAFQYEQTQSRIGGSLWEYPMRFQENSPLFYADKIETPVLMLHNDQDGAVPWYQGIEFFSALRRLEKEVYMFNYVGGGHGLRKRANQMDWTQRMQQYFDHHLRGKPASDWMTSTVPYIERGREKFTFRPPEIVEEKESKKKVTPAVGSSQK